MHYVKKKRITITHNILIVYSLETFDLGNCLHYCNTSSFTGKMPPGSKLSISCG